MKWPLNMEVPTGFWQYSESRHLHHGIITSTSLPSHQNESFQEILDCHDLTIISGQEPKNCHSTDSLPNISSTVSVPFLQCVEKPSSSLLSWKSYTEDFIPASVGFWQIDTIKSKLQHLYRDTISLDLLPADAILDNRDFATLWKSARNTNPCS